MSDQPTLGFIGLGLMGAGFIKRLVAQGYAVIGHDVVAEKCIAAKQLGATIASSPRDMASMADIIACSVTTPKNVQDIVLGENGLIAAAAVECTDVLAHATTSFYG